MSMSVCVSVCVSVGLSVCLSVYPRGYLLSHTRDIYQFFVPVSVARCSSSMMMIGCMAYHWEEGFPIDNAYISGTTHAIFTKFFMHVAYVRGSVLLQHVYDRPHRLLPGRVFFPLKMHCRPGKGDGSAQRGRIMLSVIALFYSCVFTVRVERLKDSGSGFEELA